MDNVIKKEIKREVLSNFQTEENLTCISLDILIKLM